MPRAHAQDGSAPVEPPSVPTAPPLDDTPSASGLHPVIPTTPGSNNVNHFSLPRSAGRTALSATAAAALAFGLAAPASADTTETYEGAVRTQFTSNEQSGESVTMTGGTIGTSLFRLEQENGNTATAYCIDFETSIVGGAWYLEDDWANYPGKGEFAEPGKVHWLLQNGYPSVSAEELAEASDANTGRTTEAEALAATQAAIWHFSNDEDLVRGNGNVTAIYDHLVESAEPLPQGEPEASLSVSPDSAAGQAGETVGEFTVSTSAEQVPVELTAPDGVELVDLESGESVESVADGSTVGFSVPEDTEPGEASFSLETSSTLGQGRLLRVRTPTSPPRPSSPPRTAPSPRPPRPVSSGARPTSPSPSPRSPPSRSPSPRSPPTSPPTSPATTSPPPRTRTSRSCP